MKMSNIQELTLRFKKAVLQVDLFQIIISGLCCFLLAGPMFLLMQDFGAPDHIGIFISGCVWLYLFVLAIIQVAEKSDAGKQPRKNDG